MTESSKLPGFLPKKILARAKDKKTRKSYIDSMLTYKTAKSSKTAEAIQHTIQHDFA